MGYSTKTLFFIMNDTSNLKKGMFYVLTANIINMMFSVGTNFLLPKFLTIESYAQIKSYFLYINYVAILHFGYNDGMYLFYGGKNIKSIDPKDLERNISTLRVFQFVVCAISIIFASFMHDTALIMAAIAVLPQNMLAYFKNLFQAIGEFKSYAKILNFSTGLTFAINIILLAFGFTDRFEIFLIAYIIIAVFIWFYLEYQFCKIFQYKFSSHIFSWFELKKNVSAGILLLLGNMSSQFMTGMDRWFVKLLMDSVNFAQYSFAVSMENLLNVAVTPISVTLYNYFCNHKNTDDIIRIRNYVLAFAALVISAAFPVKFVIEILLPKYIGSIKVMFILFSSQLFYIVIKSVYVNLYKARQMQKKYFTKLCLIIVIGFLLNIILYYVIHSKEVLSIGTLTSAIIWFFISQVDFQEINYKPQHYLFIFFEMCNFLLCGTFLNSIAGFVVYLSITILCIRMCIPEAFYYGIEYLLNIIRKLSVKSKSQV